MQKTGPDLTALECSRNVLQEWLAIARLQWGSSTGEDIQVCVGKAEWRHVQPLADHCASVERTAVAGAIFPPERSFAEASLDHSGVRCEFTGQDAGVDVRATLAEATKSGSGGCAGRGMLYITFVVIQLATVTAVRL